MLGLAVAYTKMDGIKTLCLIYVSSKVSLFLLDIFYSKYEKNFTAMKTENTPTYHPDLVWLYCLEYYSGKAWRKNHVLWPKTPGTQDTPRITLPPDVWKLRQAMVN